MCSLYCLLSTVDQISLSIDNVFHFVKPFINKSTVTCAEVILTLIIRQFFLPLSVTVLSLKASRLILLACLVKE